MIEPNMPVPHKRPKRTYAIIRCPNCNNLQLVHWPVKSHKCPYCDDTFNLIQSRVRPIHVAGSPREVSKILISLKKGRTTDESESRFPK
jgi:ribosomal protein S27E